MDIQSLTYGAKAVCCVHITTILLVEVQAPVVVVVIPEIREVVDVSTLGVKNLAEQTLLCHIEAGELEKVVNAVLKHHTVTACAFRCVNQLPALLQRCCCGHLDSNVLAVLHSIYSDRCVVNPVGSDVDKVDIIALAELLVSLRTYITLCFGKISLFENCLALVNIALLQVTQALNLNTLKVSETLYGTRSAHTQAHESYAYNGNGVGGKAEHRLLTSCACRLVKDNHTILQFVIITCDSTSIATTATLQHNTHQECSAENK